MPGHDSSLGFHPSRPRGRSPDLAGDRLRKGTATSSQQAAKPFTLELILAEALLRCAPWLPIVRMLNHRVTEKAQRFVALLDYETWNAYKTFSVRFIAE